MALPPFQQNLMQSNNLQKKKKVEEELGKPAFKAQGLANQQPQVPAFQTPKKVEAPKDLQPPKTLQPAAPITATPQAQPQPMLQTPKAVLEAPKATLTPMQPPAMAPVATPSLPTLPTLQPPAIARPVAPPAMAPLAQAPALDRVLAPLLQPPAERPMAPSEMTPPMMERPMPLEPKPSDINLGNILGPLVQPTEVSNKPLAPALQEMLKPVGERPPLLQPQAPTFSPSAQLPSLPPRPQAGGIPPKPDLSGILNPMLQREPIPKNEGLVPSDAVREALRPSAQEMLKPVTISTGSSPDTSGGTSEISPGAAGSSGASRFINFDRILSANQPTAREMADKTLGETVTRGQSAVEGILKADEAFKRDVQKGTPTAGTFTIGEKPGGVTAVGNILGIDEAKKLAQEATYKGPETADYFTDAYNFKQNQENYQKAQEAVKAMKSQEGLEALMNQLYNTAGGTGGSRLDAALARVSGGKGFQNVQQRFKNLDTLMQDATQRAGKYVESAKTTADRTKQMYDDAMADYEARLPGILAAREQQQIADAAERAIQADEEKRREDAGKWLEEKTPMDERVSTIGLEKAAAYAGMSLEDFMKQEAAQRGMTLAEWEAAGRPWD